VDKILVKKKKITWSTKTMQKQHPEPSRIPKTDREKWAIRTPTCWLMGVKYSYTDYEGKKKIDSMLIDAPLGLKESELEAFVDENMKSLEITNQHKQVEKIVKDMIEIPDEYEEET